MPEKARARENLPIETKCPKQLNRKERKERKESRRGGARTGLPFALLSLQINEGFEDFLETGYQE